MTSYGSMRIDLIEEKGIACMANIAALVWSKLFINGN